MIPLPAGFGGAVEAGSLADAVASTSPVYVREARAFLVAIPESVRQQLAEGSDPALRHGIESGLAAVYQKCPHLGCRVAYCESSGWFECPCHGALFTPLGEHRDGPSERGLDLFPIETDGR